MFKSKVGFQFFADAGTLVNATGNYVNAGTGQTTAFSGNDTLALLMGVRTPAALATPRATSATSTAAVQTTAMRNLLIFFFL